MIETVNQREAGSKIRFLLLGLFFSPKDEDDSLCEIG
jgi:hypothetical protein